MHTRTTALAALAVALVACAGPPLEISTSSSGGTSTGTSTGGTPPGCVGENARCPIPDAGTGACCSGSCRDIKTDLENCGVCGVLCAKACLSGACEE